MGVDSIDIITRVLRAEFPELDAERLKAAVERAVARVASASLDTEGYRVVDLHLQKVEATEESEERSKILRDLSETLEQRGDAERALVVRLSAFGEVATPADLAPLLRLARITERWSELPLDTMVALVDINQPDAASNLGELATAWREVGRLAERLRALLRILHRASEPLLRRECLFFLAGFEREAREAFEYLGRAGLESIGLAIRVERRAVVLQLLVVDERHLAEQLRALLVVVAVERVTAE
jgi:hypothetical protein